MRIFLLIGLILLLLSCHHPIKSFDSKTIPVNLRDNQAYYLESENAVLTWQENPNLQNYNTRSCNLQVVKYSFLENIEFENISGGFCPVPPESFLCLEYWNERQQECPFGCAYSFYSRQNQTIYISKNVIRFSNSIPLINELFRHETIHWLSTCTGHENTEVFSYNSFGIPTVDLPYSNSDANHLDPFLWIGDQSVLFLSEFGKQ